MISTTLFFCSCHKPKTDIITPAKQLIERQIGERAQSIHFEYIEPSDGKDIFEVIASDGRLTLRGSSSVAICYAFHTYMKEACKSMKTWSGEHITSVMPWPDYELYEQVSPYELRYFLNVCTFGYTTPYWDWERWEKEIDRMALYGVNMPLATVASEAIAERVWLRMGLNKEEIREFFTAPAHLPWHRIFCAPVPVITTSSSSLASDSFIITLTTCCLFTNTSCLSKPMYENTSLENSSILIL